MNRRTFFAGLLPSTALAASAERWRRVPEPCPDAPLSRPQIVLDLAQGGGAGIVHVLDDNAITTHLYITAEYEGWDGRITQASVLRERHAGISTWVIPGVHQFVKVHAVAMRAHGQAVQMGGDES